MLGKMMCKIKNNKKGIIKIVEASISIMLILGFLILIYSQSIERPRRSENILKWEGQILDEIKNKLDLRRSILEDSENTCKPGGEVESFVGLRLNNSFPGFSFACRICDVTDVCGPLEYKPEIFSEERIVSSTLETFSPKKIRIFVWRE